MLLVEGRSWRKRDGERKMENGLACTLEEVVKLCSAEEDTQTSDVRNVVIL